MREEVLALLAKLVLQEEPSLSTEQANEAAEWGLGAALGCATARANACPRCGLVNGGCGC